MLGQDAGSRRKSTSDASRRRRRRRKLNLILAPAIRLNHLVGEGKKKAQLDDKIFKFLLLSSPLV